MCRWQQHLNLFKSKRKKKADCLLQRNQTEQAGRINLLFSGGNDDLLDTVHVFKEKTETCISLNHRDTWFAFGKKKKTKRKAPTTTETPPAQCAPETDPVTNFADGGPRDSGPPHFKTSCLCPCDSLPGFTEVGNTRLAPGDQLSHLPCQKGGKLHRSAPRPQNKYASLQNPRPVARRTRVPWLFLPPLPFFSW